ncbi:unnamed protein product [Cylindrotheca closterium]|uniref:Uncharacterized protein n=1 Tax=Cylindrotheca closterium TaxID=2856 RepID=A0AAD2FTN3_9STRA|nr:unnamed protein product [Cylindrotheca closterium]
MKTRDKIVVIWFSFLYLVIWAFSLANLFHVHFWDKRHALSTFMEDPESLDKGFTKIGKSYYTSLRYIWFLPHVLGAIFWWNLYFLQLIPMIRHNYKPFHRMLGRFLLTILLIQNVTGFGLASTSGSNVITMVSYILNVASIFCIVKAWRYAYFRDIALHKYWVLRLVGYMHTISLQRFFLVLLIITHSMGWDGLYPQLDETTASDEEWIQLVKGMFDDSFVLSILFAILSTEWYLAAVEGKMETPIDNRKKGDIKRSGPNETSSLVLGVSPYGAISS